MLDGGKMAEQKLSGEITVQFSYLAYNWKESFGGWVKK